MSKTVDQKVVQMQFDNQGFEKNAKETMSTLDKLKAALKFEGANKGVEELNKSIKGLDFGQAEIMATRAGFHIQDVFLKISNVLEYQIARKIIHIGENIARSLTLEQVTAGFNEYQLKMDSINTIMASTGENIETVNGYLEELNHYSDKTIYSFSDMTQNIGKFTNAGVKLEDAVSAIQGVANVAAVSGANANEASRAMYNFAQALSAGYVKLIDWKSIENANMATVEFKETLLDTAVAMGTVEKGTDGMYKVLSTNMQGKKMDQAISATRNFNDSLNYQWMTTGVLTQALEIYSKDVRDMTEEEKKNYEEALKRKGFNEDQIKAFEELGIKATDAATKVRTFQQLFDAIKESIGSGWAMAFENVIGNLNEARDLLTEIKDAADSIISSGFNRLNGILKNWKSEALGGRDALIQAFRNLAGALSDVIMPIKDVIRQIFPPTSSLELANITKRFRDWTASLRLNKTEQENLRVALHYLLTPLKIIVELIKFVAKFIPPVLTIVGQFVKLIFNLVALLANFGKESGAFQKIADGWHKAFRKLLQITQSVKKAISDLARTIVDSFVKALQDENSWLNKTLNVLKMLGSITLGALSAAFNTIVNFKFSDVVTALENMKTKIKELAESSTFFRILLDAFQKLKDVFGVVKDSLIAFISSLSERMATVETFGDFLKALWEAIKDTKDYLEELINSKFFADGPGLFETIKNTFTDFIDTLKGGLQNIPWAKLVLIGLSLALATCCINLVTAISKFGGLAGALKETVSIVNATIKSIIGIRNKLIELKTVALYIAIVAASIGALAMIDAKYGNLGRVAAILGALAGGIMLLAEAMLWINAKNAFNVTSLASMMGALAGLAGATAILIAAVSALKEMSMTLDEALPYLKTLGVIMLGVLAAMTVLTLIAKDHKVFTAGAISILSYSSAVYILAKGLKSLEDVKFVDINNILKLLAEIMIGFALISSLAGKFGSGWGFASIIAMTASLKIIADVLSSVSQLELSSDAKHLLDTILDLVKYFGTLAIIAVTLKSIFGKTATAIKSTSGIASKLKSGFSSLSFSLLAIAGSFYLISQAFKTLSELLNDVTDWTKFIGVLGTFVLLIGAVYGLFRGMTKGLKDFKNLNAIRKFGSAVLLLSLALIPLSLALDLLTSIVEGHDLGSVIAAGAFIAAMGGIMAGLMKAAGNLKLTSFKSILAIVASLALIIAELAAVSLMIDKYGLEMLASLIIFEIVALSLAQLMEDLLKMTQKYGKLDVKSLITVTGSIVALTGVLAGLAVLIDQVGGGKVGIALAILLGIVSSLDLTILGLAAITKKIGTIGSIAPLIAVVGSLVVLAGVLSGLTFLVASDAGNQIWDALIIMGGILAALVIAMKVLSTDTNVGDWATYLGFAAVIVAIAGSLVLMAQVPWDNLARAGIVLAGFVGAMELLFLGMTAITDGTMGTAALVVLGFSAAIVAITLSFTAFTSAATSFVKAVDHIIETFIKLGNSGDDVAKGIAAAVPAIVKAIDDIATGIMKSSPKIAVAINNIVTGIALAIADATPIIAKALYDASQYLLPLIHDIIVTAAATIGEALTILIDSLGQYIPDFITLGLNLFTGFVDGLLERTSELTGIAQGWIGAILAVLNPAGAIMYAAGKLLKGNFLSGATPTDGEIQVINETYENAYAGSMTSMLQATEKTISLENKKIRRQAGQIPTDAGKAMAASAESGGKYAQNAMATVANAATAGLTPVQKYTAMASDNLLGFFNTAKNTIGSGSITSWIANLGNNVVDWFGDKIPSVFDEDNFGLTTLIEKFGEVPAAAAAAGAGVEGVGKSASKGAKGVKELNDEMSQYVEKMESSFNILDEFDLGLDEENPLTGDKILQNMQSNIDGMATWANEMVSLAGKVPEGLYKKLADMGPTGYKYVHAFTQMTEEQLSQVAQLYAQSLVIPTSVTQQIYGGMSLAAQNAYTGFVNGLNIPGMQQNGVDMATALIDGLAGPNGLDEHSPSRVMFDLGVLGAFGLGDGFASPAAIGYVTIKLEDLAKSIIDTVEKNLSKDNFIDVGKNITKGLKEGIEEGESDLGAAVKSMCDKVIARTKSKEGLWENSPSRKFKEIGKFVSQGLAQGISEDADEVELSAMKLAKATVDNMRDAVATIQAAVDSDMEVEPVIRPVVDLSNIQNGANSISSLMGMNFGSDVTMPAASFMQSSQLVNMSDNTDVVVAVTSLKDDITGLKKAMTNIKMVLDTGTVVGALTPMIDKEMGVRAIYAGRGM